MVGGGCRLPAISSLSAPLHQQIVLSSTFLIKWPTGEYSLLAAQTFGEINKKYTHLVFIRQSSVSSPSVFIVLVI